ITIVGCAAAWPLAARAQQLGKRYTIGLFSAGIRPENTQSVAFWSALYDALRELGGSKAKMSSSSAALRKIGSKAARAGSGTGPTPCRRHCRSRDARAAGGEAGYLDDSIVMTAAGDPVGSALVASLARPGGNVTGMSLMAPDLGGKRLELLKEILP